MLRNGKNKPKISIIVPVYNVEQYLEECLHSLIQQTLIEIEIICVDDCSSDNSGNIIDSYAIKDPRIKPIHLKKNCGTVVREKMGLCKHKAVILCFVMRTICINLMHANEFGKKCRQIPLTYYNSERMSGMEKRIQFGEAKS